MMTQLPESVIGLMDQTLDEYWDSQEKQFAAVRDSLGPPPAGDLNAYIWCRGLRDLLNDRRHLRTQAAKGIVAAQEEVEESPSPTAGQVGPRHRFSDSPNAASFFQRFSVGMALGLMTRADVEARILVEEELSRGHSDNAAYYRALLEKMGPEPEGRVADYWSEKAAEKLWKRVRRRAG